MPLLGARNTANRLTTVVIPAPSLSSADKHRSPAHRTQKDSGGESGRQRDRIRSSARCSKVGAGRRHDTAVPIGDKSDSNFNQISVRSFIPTGVPPCLHLQIPEWRLSARQQPKRQVDLFNYMIPKGVEPRLSDSVRLKACGTTSSVSCRPCRARARSSGSRLR